MFPSSTSINSSLQNPFEYSSSIDENPNQYFFNFPTHLLDDDELLFGHFTHHHHHQQEQEQEQSANGGTATTTTTLREAPEVSTENSNKANINRKKDISSEAVVAAEQQKAPSETGKKKRGSGTRQPGLPRRRTGKKDRHSKIYTAQGPRDRRMRLSLQIARKFFDLQDMLGFDKASKTIEWLFTKSKAAIKELTVNLPHRKNISCGSVSSSAASECIGMEMGVEDTSIQRQLREMMIKRKSKGTRKGSGNSSTTQYAPCVAKESREKARARARQRTREKKLQTEIEKRKQLVNPNTTITNSNSINNNNNTRTNNFKKPGSSNTTPETGEESAGCELPASLVAAMAMGVGKCNNHQSLEHQMATVGIIEKLLGTSRSSMFDYQQDDHDQVAPVVSTSGMLRSLNDHELLGFPGIWVAENARIDSSGYGAVMLNIAADASPLQDPQNPNSFFMSGSAGDSYLQSQYLHNQFS
ncbi:hypothetical protein Ancab_018576 [Ancistrocladus abbreviatus]